MIFKILKLIGLDVPARIAEVRADLERRVEDAAGQVKQAASMAATIAVLYALAGVAALFACIVGLIALFRYVDLTYGEFYGFAAVGGLLVILAGILIAAAMAQAKSWTKTAARASQTRHEHALADASAARAEQATQAMATASLADQTRHETAAHLYDANAAGSPAARMESASDLVEPLAFLLSRAMKFPSTGNPVLDEVVGHLRVAARETTDEAIEGAARTVRDGSRGTLVMVLGSATFLGWLLARHGHLASSRGGLSG